MSGFILECLFATGWRRTGDLYWRLSDAKREADKRVRGGRVRATRVLAVSINSESVYSVDAEAAAS